VLYKVCIMYKLKLFNSHNTSNRTLFKCTISGINAIHNTLYIIGVLERMERYAWKLLPFSVIVIWSFSVFIYSCPISCHLCIFILLYTRSRPQQINVYSFLPWGSFIYCITHTYTRVRMYLVCTHTSILLYMYANCW